MFQEESNWGIFKKWYLWVLFIVISLLNTPWWAIEITPSRVLGALVGNFIIALIIAFIIFLLTKKIKRK